MQVFLFLFFFLVFLEGREEKTYDPTTFLSPFPLNQISFSFIFSPIFHSFFTSFLKFTHSTKRNLRRKDNAVLNYTNTLSWQPINSHFLSNFTPPSSQHVPRCSSFFLLFFGPVLVIFQLLHWYLIIIIFFHYSQRSSHTMDDGYNMT